MTSGFNRNTITLKPVDIFIFICSYPNTNYSTRINYYSSSSTTVRFNGIATGNTATDNQALLLERRFLMAAVGNEATACPSTVAVGNKKLLKLTLLTSNKDGISVCVNNHPIATH